MGYRRWDRLPKGLDFGITCPTIDGEISFIDEMIYEMLQERGIPDAEKVSDDISAALLPHIERVRQTNIAMRMAADDQIKELVGEIENLREQVEEKDKEITRLEREIDDLK